jgi:hypothetical protein
MTAPSTNTDRASESDGASKLIVWVGYVILGLATGVFWVLGITIRYLVHELIGDKPWPNAIYTFLRQPNWILLLPLIWLPVLWRISRSRSVSLHKAVLLVLLMQACLVIVGGIVLFCGICICWIFCPLLK